MDARGFLKLSVAVAVANIALKTAAWWLTDSVGLLSDAIESLVNLAGAGFALMMVVIARRPADEDHPYGHHKAEYFSSALEGALIFAAAAAILAAALERFVHPRAIETVGVGLTLSVLSAVLNGVLAMAMLREARRERSIALEADARHLITDVWTTVGVVVGVIAVKLTGVLWLDPMIAVGVALNILREGASLVWSSVRGLMDEALEPDVQAQIERTLAEFAHPSIRFDHVSTRRAGQRRFVDLHMHVPASWSLGQAAKMRSSVERALMRSVPGLRATIQLLPMDVEAYPLDREDPH
jgi:cation diffusion facilitator family transporter